MKKLLILFIVLFALSCIKQDKVISDNGIIIKCVQESHSPRKFLFLGDSQMEFPGGPYELFVKKYPNESAYKIAKGGVTSTWLLDTLAKCTLDYTDVIIFIGTNDNYQFPETEVSRDNLVSIISLLRRKVNCNITFYTVPPSKNFIGWSPERDVRIGEFNDFIKKLPDVSIVDDYALVNDNQAIRSGYHDQFRYHLNQYAHDTLFSYLTKILDVE